MVVLRQWWTSGWIALLAAWPFLLVEIIGFRLPHISKLFPTSPTVSRWALGVKRSVGGAKLVYEDEFHVQEFSGESDDIFDDKESSANGKDPAHYNE